MFRLLQGFILFWKISRCCFDVSNVVCGFVFPDCFSEPPHVICLTPPSTTLSPDRVSLADSCGMHESTHLSIPCREIMGLPFVRGGVHSSKIGVGSGRNPRRSRFLNLYIPSMWPIPLLSLSVVRQPSQWRASSDGGVRSPSAVAVLDARSEGAPKQGSGADYDKIECHASCYVSEPQWQ